MEIKNIALVAHDNRKKDLIEWNYKTLILHNFICTRTTGKLVEEVLKKKARKDDKTFTIQVQKPQSGPLGGDQQIGSLIVEGKIDFMIFFWDLMEPHPHDLDVKALLRISVLYNFQLPATDQRLTL